MYIRLFGALIITVSGIIIGFNKSREIQDTVSALFELSIMLEQMKNEIVTMRTPVTKLLARMENNDFKHIDVFIKELDLRLYSLGEVPFHKLWSECAMKTLGCLPGDIKYEICSLGQTIGRSDAGLQSHAIDRCIAMISAEYDARKSGLDSNRKMYMGLATGAGLILSIIMF